MGRYVIKYMNRIYPSEVFEMVMYFLINVSFILYISLGHRSSSIETLIFGGGGVFLSKTLNTNVKIATLH